ncbi:hypothetical protein RSOLAG1IB_08222 [Rhizoctonia solani AG-1 IB]|uniref:Uncharacterized protein n=1 Tax=Thanatephorus cucumeris (strain AG1-IB / isolate 7/3/14) TaxID=1108050 RepID=A0A0B7FJ47_THACB|nr:hypothetical protein RSOLAG1IB_08222 [Rhizoctonia solani AG-1 IB]
MEIVNAKHDVMAYIQGTVRNYIRKDPENLHRKHKANSTPEVVYCNLVAREKWPGSSGVRLSYRTLACNAS